MEHLEKKLDRIEAKLETGFASVNAQLLVIAKTQGEHEGRIKGHSTQISWLWGLLCSGVLAGIAAMFRSIT
jgi:hypothetical protein